MDRMARGYDYWWWTELLRLRYPTGRKNCTRCGRWRPVTDFDANTAKHTLAASGRPMILRAMCKVCDKQRVRARKGHKMAEGSHHNSKIYDSAAERMRAVYAIRKANPELHRSHMAKKAEWHRRKRRGLIGTQLPMTVEFAELWRREVAMRPGCTEDPSLLGLNRFQYEHLENAVRRSRRHRAFVRSQAVDAFMTYVDKQYLLLVLWGPEDWRKGRPKVKAS